MLDVNSLYNLPVLSLYEGELIGKVDKLYFDKKIKKLESIEVVNDEGIKYILPTKNIYKIGKNAITIKNNQLINLSIDESTSFSSCPIGMKTYTIKGNYIGTIKRIEIDDKYLTSSIVLDNDSLLDTTLLASCGKTTVIVCDKTQAGSINSFKRSIMPKLFKSKNPTPVSIEEPNQELVLKKTKSNPTFIVGRIATKTILNQNGDTIINANSTVTKRTVELAQKFNKLKELMIVSKPQ